MITKQFELNKERLRKEFMSPQYEEKRKWFFKTYSKFMGNHIREKYYDFMNEIQAKVKFFDWFDSVSLKVLIPINWLINPRIFM